MSVLTALFTPAYFTSQNLLILHLCRMVTLSLLHGNTEASAHGHGWYGMVLGERFKKYREGQAFGELALEVVERHNFSTSRGKVRYSLETIGFEPELRARLFAHGFTTRKEGHGFGLHSSALAAKMLGGHLSLESAGPYLGATATLEIPLTTKGPGRP
ncbi:hypothetical protein JQX13_21975 [Archangium violaceum]|nr:ATP-binding protein [Archangium violaceum]QRK12455.1 hypothetical protein JQX13_21975 [Archangium violaceum]